MFHELFECVKMSIECMNNHAKTKIGRFKHDITMNKPLKNCNKNIFCLVSLRYLSFFDTIFDNFRISDGLTEFPSPSSQILLSVRNPV